MTLMPAWTSTGSKRYLTIDLDLLRAYYGIADHLYTNHNSGSTLRLPFQTIRRLFQWASKSFEAFIIRPCSLSHLMRSSEVLDSSKPPSASYATSSSTGTQLRLRKRALEGGRASERVCRGWRITRIARINTTL